MKLISHYLRKYSRAVLSSLALLALVSFVPVGCQSTLNPSGVYAGDRALYEAEGAITTSHDVLQEFVNWEYNHREYLAQWPEVRKLADSIVDDGPQWFIAASVARDAYVGNPNSTNRSTLQASIDVLQSVVRSAQTILTKYVTAPGNRTTNAPASLPRSTTKSS